MVSEYWEKGTSLCKRLQEIGRMDEEQARFYVMQLAHALMSIHFNKRIIRRLCLCNVLLEPSGFTRLAPYSLCDQNLDCGQACNMLVRNCGDQFYASPEVVFGVDVQPAADWWSLGVILYQLLTGELPFTGRTLGDLGKAITEYEPRLPSNISGEACAILKHLLQKDPRRRLGFGPHGSSDIMAHPWFCRHSWQNVQGHHLEAPYSPEEDAEKRLQPHVTPLIKGSPTKTVPDKNKAGNCHRPNRLK